MKGTSAPLISVRKSEAWVLRSLGLAEPVTASVSVVVSHVALMRPSAMCASMVCLAKVWSNASCEVSDALAK